MTSAAVAVFANTFFEKRVEQLFTLAALIDRIFVSAGVDYRIVGGLAVYLYVEEAEPDAGRLTRDIDILVSRSDLAKIAQAAGPFGLLYRHVAGLDMLVQADQPSARRAVHMVFSGEKVRADNLEAAPEFGPYRAIQGVRLIPVADLVRMKLTSFRLKDQAHLKDLDEAGLLSADIDAVLPPVLRARLALVRAHE